MKHHDEFTRRWAGRKIHWSEVCAELAALGETDTKGKPPTEVNARKTWQRVRKQVAAARAVQAVTPPSRGNPSRLDKNWRPENAPEPPTPSAPAPVPASGSFSLKELMPVRRTSPQDDDDYDPKAQKARMRRVIAQRSGH